jgi:5-methylcytosine-specific restriction endonuclease McrA
MSGPKPKDISGLRCGKGGTSWPHNLQLTCPRCNHSKYNRDSPYPETIAA